MVPRPTPLKAPTRRFPAHPARGLFLVLLAGWLVGCGEPSPPADPPVPIRSDALRAFIDERLPVVGGEDLPSLSVGVAVGNEVVFAQAYGWADREQKRKATPETIYAVGSISKALTATGVMVLAERGVIDLDAPANTYLAASPLQPLDTTWAPVTVRHLLQMTGGIPHMWWHNWSDRGTPAPATNVFLQDYGLSVFPPGEQFFYSNLSFGILAQIIANVSGGSFEDFMIRDVFEPLGMTSTRILVQEDEADAARLYDPEVAGPLPYEYLFPAGGGGFRRRRPDQQ